MDDNYSTSSLGRQAAFPEALLCQLLEELSHQGQAKSIIASTLGQRPALSEKALTYLIALAKDWNHDVRGLAAYALGQQPTLSPKALDRLITLVKDEDQDVRESAATALSKQPVWEGYRLLSTQDSRLKEHYGPWLIKQNFQQIVPFYIEGNTLYFYTLTELQSVSLTAEAAFRQAIRDAQDAVGIPLASRVKTNPSITSMQGNAVSLSRTVSSSTLFHRSEGPHDNESQESLRNRDTRVGPGVG